MTTTTATTTGTTVLGIGNPLMGDDGVGIRLLEELMAAGLPQPVEFVDGGTIGMSLLPMVLDADSLLVLDAVAGATPGTVIHLSGDQLPRLLRTKLSPHQVDLLDVLAGARLLGSEPRRIAVVGVAPDVVDLRLGLSADVEAAVPHALRLARRVLDEWTANDMGESGGQSCSGVSIST